MRGLGEILVEEPEAQFKANIVQTCAGFAVIMAAIVIIATVLALWLGAGVFAFVLVVVLIASLLAALWTLQMQRLVVAKWGVQPPYRPLMAALRGDGFQVAWTDVKSVSLLENPWMIPAAGATPPVELTLHTGRKVPLYSDSVSFDTYRALIAALERLPLPVTRSGGGASGVTRRLQSVDAARRRLAGLGFRPVWVAAWAGIAYGALLLVPTILPTAGPPFPRWVWFGVLAEAAVCLVLGAATRTRGTKGNPGQWFVAGFTAPICSVVFTVGAVVLLLGTFGPLEVGMVGLLSLWLLGLLDRWGIEVDARWLVLRAEAPGP